MNELTKNIQQTDPAIEKLSHELQTIKTMVEKQPTSHEILEKIDQMAQQQKAPFESALKDIHSKVEPLHQASRDVFPFTFHPLSPQSLDLVHRYEKEKRRYFEENRSIDQSRSSSSRSNRTNQ